MSPVADQVFDGTCGRDARTSKLYEAISVARLARKMIARFILFNPLGEFRNSLAPDISRATRGTPRGQRMGKSPATS
jgi:hypothetical protein